MCENEKLIIAVLEAVTENAGKKKLTCEAAFELAERFKTDKLEVSKICNQNNIKISACQLGCFR